MQMVDSLEPLVSLVDLQKFAQPYVKQIANAARHYGSHQALVILAHALARKVHQSNGAVEELVGRVLPQPLVQLFSRVLFVHPDAHTPQSSHQRFVVSVQDVVENLDIVQTDAEEVRQVEGGVGEAVGLEVDELDLLLLLPVLEHDVVGPEVVVTYGRPGVTRADHLVVPAALVLIGQLFDPLRVTRETRVIPYD